MSNNTKIQYIKISDKLYQITDISFFHMTVEAVETNLAVSAVPEAEVFDLGFFRNYKIRLVNTGGKAEIVDLEAWKSKNDGKNGQ